MAKGIPKSKKHIIATAVVTAILCGAGFYQYGNWEGYNTGYSAGSAGVGVTAVTVDAASVQATMNATTFAHASTVASDGAVATQTSVTATFWINNTDDEEIAQDVYVRLINPRTYKEGLHDNRC